MNPVFNVLRSGRLNGIGTGALQLTSTSAKLRNGITILASSGNTTSVFVGPTGVTAGGSNTTCGFPLSPNVAISLGIDDPSRVFVIGGAGASNQEVYWVGN